MKYLDLTGLGEVWANIKSYISSKIPTKTSQLQNDSNYVTTSQLPSKTSQLTNDSDFTTNAKLATKQDTISDLATIRSGASKGATAVQPSELTSKANDSDVVHKSGDETINGFKTFTSETFNTSPNAFRHIFGDYGAFWRNDGYNLYLMLTNSGDQYGGWNNFRPLIVNLATGVCNISGTAGGVAWTNVSGRPTKVSQFTNDSGYITSGDVVDRTRNQSINGNKRFNNLIQTNNGLIVNNTDTNNFMDIRQGWIEISSPNYCGIDFKHETSQDYLGRIALSTDNTLYLETINGAPIMANGKNIVRSVNGVNADNNGNVNIQNSLLPIGSYIQFAGSQAPSGFLVCNGGAISRTTYAKLFAVIGTTYGGGDGSTTFNLPNLIDRFLQGSAKSGTVKYAGLPNIMGTINIGTVDNAPESYSNGALSMVSAGDQGYQRAGGVRTLRSISFDASNYNHAYGNSSTIQPPALTCLICIKY